MELDKAITSRKSVRKYKDKTPDWRKIIEAIDSARYAPMAGNNFTIKFIVIDEKKKIEKIAEASQQPFISQAKYVVVVCSNPSRLITAYEKRGEKFNKQQVGAAIENFLLKITELGLSTCWIGYFDDNVIKRELKIPSNIELEALFPIGFEYEKSYTKREKVDIDTILFFNEFENRKMKKPAKVD